MQISQKIKTYHFHITQLGPTYVFLLSLFGGVVLLILIPVVFLLNNQGQSIYILYLCGFVTLLMTIGIIYSIWKIRKIRVLYDEPEKIILKADHIVSHYWGTVRFEHIHSYSIQHSLPWNKASLTLKIKLHDQRVIRLDPKLDQEDTQMEQYLEFLSDLVAQWSVFKQSLDKQTNDSCQKISSCDSFSLQNSQFEHDTEIITKVRKKKKQNNIVIPLSFIIGFVLFSRFFGGKLIQFYKAKPIKDMITYSEQRSNKYSTLLRRAIAQQAAVYMYTNDSLAKIGLVPYIKGLNLDGHDLLNVLNTDTEVLNFLTYKKDRRFYLSLESDRGFWRQVQNVEEAKQNKFTTIQLLLSNKHDKTVASKLGIQVVWEFVFKSQKDLEEQLHRDTFELNNLSYFKKQESSGAKWYLVGMESGAISLESFQIASKTIVDFLSKDPAFTSSFKVHVHNKSEDSLDGSVEEIMDASVKELQQIIEIRERIKHK